MRNPTILLILKLKTNMIDSKRQPLNDMRQAYIRNLSGLNMFVSSQSRIPHDRESVLTVQHKNKIQNSVNKDFLISYHTKYKDQYNSSSTY